MKKEINPSEKIGVVVGRFQVASLTEGHKELLDYVLSKNYNSNILILGLSPLKCTINNPLDYEARRIMIEQAYPGKFSIHYLKDNRSDEEWSNQLDSIIDDVKMNRDVDLIGSRDCFFNHYFGKYKDNFIEYSQKSFVSGTEQRKRISMHVKSESAWRAGCIYATQNQYPSVYATVDCAIFHDNSLKQIYLAKKKGEKLYRFVGGFSSPTDDSFETAARREAIEETKLEVSIIGYIGSTRIDDWRYSNETNKVITNFYAMVKVFGRAEPSDDICTLDLMDFETLTNLQIIEEHRDLFNMLVKWRDNYLKNSNNIGECVRKQLD